jgi:hypothetical protein
MPHAPYVVCLIFYNSVAGREPESRGKCQIFLVFSQAAYAAGVFLPCCDIYDHAEFRKRRHRFGLSALAAGVPFALARSR